MSTLMFPDLPGADVAVSREPRYVTKIQEAVSGREVRTSWRTQPRVRYTLRFNFLRTATQAPSPNQGYSETGVILAFLDAHKGAFDSFQFRDPYTSETVQVRLVEDSVRMTKIVNGVWSVDSLQLDTVI